MKLIYVEYATYRAHYQHIPWGQKLCCAGYVRRVTHDEIVWITNLMVYASCILIGSWRDGYGGAFRIGLEHGAYCLGCCWLLFVILFPLGIMNIAVTALIFAEKALPIGRQISQLAGVGLIIYGVLVMVLPAALPMGM